MFYSTLKIQVHNRQYIVSLKNTTNENCWLPSIYIDLYGILDTQISQFFKLNQGNPSDNIWILATVEHLRPFVRKSNLGYPNELIYELNQSSPSVFRKKNP